MTNPTPHRRSALDTTSTHHEHHPGAGAGPPSAPTAQDWSTHHHALRQPLHAIGLFCAALRGAGIPTQAQGLVDGIAASASAMETALDELFVQISAATTLPALTPNVSTVETRSLQQMAPPPTYTPTPPGPCARVRPACILVVDDEPSALLSLGMLLEAWGAEVLGFDSLDKLRTFLGGSPAVAPDLCIVDYNLGRTGEGLEALSMLRHAWPGTNPAIVMMTGDVSAAKALQHTQPVLQVLIKPVAPATLTALIEDLVQGLR